MEAIRQSSPKFEARQISREIFVSLKNDNDRLLIYLTLLERGA